MSDRILESAENVSQVWALVVQKIQSSHGLYKAYHVLGDYLPPPSSLYAVSDSTRKGLSLSLMAGEGCTETRCPSVSYCGPDRRGRHHTSLELVLFYLFELFHAVLNCVVLLRATPTPVFCEDLKSCFWVDIVMTSAFLHVYLTSFPSLVTGMVLCSTRSHAEPC